MGMTLKVLTQDQVEQFMDNGWVKVEQAFPREAALKAQQIVWSHVEKRGPLQNDPSTWTQDMVRINESFDDEEFQHCNSLRIADAIEDLIGEGRRAKRIVYGESTEKTSYGWWPVNFSMGADKPWGIPTEGWHWDGIQFKHFIDSPDQGLLCLCLFSDIGPRGGGTLVAEGSHKLVAKFLAQHPEGIELKDALPLARQSHPWLEELTNPDSTDQEGRMEKFLNWTTDSEGVRLRVVETTGGPGDVFLCHPFLYHAASQNHSGVVRFMCNRTTALKEHLQLYRTDASPYSPLELSIRQALA
jgi:hypothetical protein